MDDMIAVDPKLFITCRLCLDDMGLYQILPSVQAQIKYCYDIDVKPFDGLPQLICIKCKGILNDYYSTKKSYCKKQNALRNNVQKDVSVVLTAQQQQDTVSSTQPQPEQTSNDKSNDSDEAQHKQTTNDKSNEVPIKVEKKNKLKATKNRARLCSDSDSEPTFRVVLKTKGKRKSPKHTTVWEDNYDKHFMCTICNSPWADIKNFNSHILGHATLRAKHCNVLRNYCTVRLNKIDDKPNITGYKNIVVHDKNKIIGCGNPFYYVMFSSKTTQKEYNKHSNGKNRGTMEESSDDDNIIKHRASKRRRIDSRSSLDTVVLDSKNSKNDASDGEDLNKNQCINIEDSSDSDSVESKSSPEVSKKPLAARLNDFKTIHNIISTCSANYQKKKEESEKEQADMNDVTSQQLKHIILSIGRKVLNSNFKCAGLLKYLKYKNLDINWIPNVNQVTGKDADYIRILARERPQSNTAPEWVNVEKKTNVNQGNLLSLQNLPTISDNKRVTDVIIETNEATSMTSTVTTSGETPAIDQNEDSKLYTNFQDAFAHYGNSDLKNRLLNANPVANPKQLPRKLLNEMKSPNILKPPPPYPTDIQSGYSMPVLEIDPILNAIDSNDAFNESGFSNDPPIGLPIITSATSLAEPTTLDAGKRNSDTTVTSGPRIKVKPVSELMSERSLDFLRREQKTPEPANNLVMRGNNVLEALSVPNAGAYPMRLSVSGGTILQVIQNNDVQPVPPNFPVTAQSETAESGNTVVLHTVELPNTRTVSPFCYFKNLLHIHNLVLIKSNDSLPSQYMCLVKFKVVFRQEFQDKPVKLCLSLMSFENNFCIKVRDSKQYEIDIYKFSANWQWEILQVFTGNVVNKVLQTAVKIGPEVCMQTKKFFSILKSIQIVK